MGMLPQIKPKRCSVRQLEVPMWLSTGGIVVGGTVWSLSENPCRAEGNVMTEYIVGLRLGKRSEVLTIEAGDALIAALKAKYNHPEALISYVRKSNRRGDRRNPHRKE